MSQNQRVLIVEDSPSFVATIKAYLGEEPYTLAFAETGRAALAALEAAAPDVVLLDLQLPDMNGMRILERIGSRGLDCAVIVITANSSVQTAVDAMRVGAYDYVLKPFSADRLRLTIQNALERQALSRVVNTVRAAARDSYQGFIGASLPMQAVYRTIDAAASSKAPVFVTGESGTGKELCAQAIHAQSSRRAGPFVALNCAAIPRDLMESEIFGHVKGAFTGATSDRPGAARRADGGTLFLDEVAEMDADLQTKLLRFLQTGTVQKLGAGDAEKVDVRIVSATNRDPMAEVEAGRFREDLFYRLHVIPIEMPPLRARGEDVMTIADHLLRRIAEEEGKDFEGFDAEARARLAAYDWPGNVRQLENVVRNVVVLQQGPVVTLDMLPAPLNGARVGTAAPAASQRPEPAGAPSDIKPLWLVEKEAIERALERFDGNVTQAARALGTAPSTLYRKRQGWLSKSLRSD